MKGVVFGFRNCFVQAKAVANSIRSSAQRLGSSSASRSEFHWWLLSVVTSDHPGSSRMEKPMSQPEQIAALIDSSLAGCPPLSTSAITSSLTSTWPNRVEANNAGEAQGFVAGELGLP